MRTLYAAYVRLPRRFACVIEHDAEFPFAPTGTRVEAVLRPQATKGGRWCPRGYRGVIRLHRVAPGITNATERVGRFSFRIR